MRNLCRIDRIHVTPALRERSAYRAFVSKAEHKAVHVTCHPPIFDDSVPRFRCHEEFLEDEERVSRVLHAISSIEAPPKDLWDIAVNIVLSEATAYHREVAPHKILILRALGAHVHEAPGPPSSMDVPQNKGVQPPIGISSILTARCPL